MPFAAQTQMDDPNDPRKNAQGGVNISGQSNSVTTNLPGQDAAAAAGGKSKSSGQYTNIQTYLDANKQQGDAMGTKISDDIGAKAEDATQKIQKFETAAPKVAEYNPDEVLGRVTSLSADEQSQYKTNKKTGGYTGPADISGVEGYEDVNKQATQVAGLVKNVGTEAGQRDLLKNTYARPSYSAGENNLDQALVQGSAGSRAKLETLGQKYSGISDALSTANTNVGNAINQANTQAMKNKQAFVTAEQKAREALINPLQQRAELANKNNGAMIDRVLADAGDETLSEETLAALGLTGGEKLFDLNLANYVQQDRSQVGLDNVANAEERQKYQALASLFEDQTMNQITANGKEIKPLGFDKTKFDQDYAGKQAEFNRIAAGTNLSGAGAREWYGENLRGTAAANVGNWMSDNNAVNYNYRADFGAVNDDGSAEMADVRAQARNSLYAQINNFLNAQNYNRTIKKG